MPDACTTTDTCSGGSCQAGSPLVCEDDGDPCTAGFCDAVLGCTTTDDRRQLFLPVDDYNFCRCGFFSSSFFSSWTKSPEVTLLFRPSP